MNYLLDTHILVWAIGESNRLSLRHKEIIEDKNNNIYASYFNYMEIIMKLKLNKWSDFKPDINIFYEQVENAGIININLSFPHIKYYLNLPFFEEHRDPFDRFIISTGIVEKLKILTVDNKFSLYKEYVEVL